MSYNEPYERNAVFTIKELNARITKLIKEWKVVNTPETRLVFMRFSKEFMKNSLTDSINKATLIGEIDVEIFKLERGVLN